MTDVQAALGIHQLPRLNGWIVRRAELADRYTKLLANLPLTLPPPAAPESVHAWHLYTVQVTDDAPLTRDELLDALNAQRVGSGVHYRAVHLHPFYRDKYGIRPEELPVSSSISERTLSLPLSPKVTDRDQDDVVDALTYALGRRSARPPGVAFGRA
jgi:dTDP-4-amino-4,6-dideoxygalactose transaminase